MRIVGLYSFNGGLEYVRQHFPNELNELKKAIENVHAEAHKTKVSREKTMPGKILYSPVDLNKAFKAELFPLGWKNIKEKCDYSGSYYIDGYENPLQKKVSPFRDMDFVKNQLGIEVQFGKYSFMVYNVCAKMTIFKKMGHITAGVEVVPVKELAEQMSTGVSYFEQFVWDLEQRGVSDIDIPVMIVGIAP
jgi:Restriction endonuclease BglII